MNRTFEMVAVAKKAAVRTGNLVELLTPLHDISEDYPQTPHKHSCQHPSRHKADWYQPQLNQIQN